MESRKFQFEVVCLTLLSLISVSYPKLQCFNCHSQVNEHCLEINSSASGQWLQECARFDTFQDTDENVFCKKLQVIDRKLNKTEEVIRSCAYSKWEGVDSCKTEYDDDYITITCQCGTDACNSAQTFGIQKWSTSFVLVMFVTVMMPKVYQL